MGLVVDISQHSACVSPGELGVGTGSEFPVLTSLTNSYCKNPHDYTGEAIAERQGRKVYFPNPLESSGT